MALTPDGVRELERAGVRRLRRDRRRRRLGHPRRRLRRRRRHHRRHRSRRVERADGGQGEGAAAVGVRPTSAPTSRCSRTSTSPPTRRWPRRCSRRAPSPSPTRPCSSPTGALPLLAPMSEVAGRIATQIGAHYLERHNGGRGRAAGRRARRAARRAVVVLGAGNVGWNAAWIAAGMEAEVCLLDKNLDRLRFVDQIHKRPHHHAGVEPRRRRAGGGRGRPRDRRRARRRRAGPGRRDERHGARA